MRLILAQIGSEKPVAFATKEISRLIKAMDNTVTLDVRKYNEKNPSVKNALWIGLDGSLELSDKDAIYISVENGTGIITGSNERSVLMAAYRFMYELGCRFLRPGSEGEIIPERVLTYKDLKAEVNETPSYNHRAICIEGSVGSEHVYNTIDWLPKVGMSGFFSQFFTPGVFFRRYYKRFYEDQNDRDFGNEITNEEIDAIMASLVDEIEKRGMVYHAIGHGWTCAPFGLNATGWDKFTDEIPEEIKNIIALKDGKREFHQRIPLNTNLCYSNPYVQEKMTDCIMDFCKNNKNIDYLHFWLGDGVRNHCECDECQKKIPSDYYVDMLNMLDDKLSHAGIDTKIVFLMYHDTLSAPLKEKIKNPDRFTLMFAPISRSFSHSYGDVDLDNLPETPDYVRNKAMKEDTVEINVAYLKKWQENFKGDSFAFDYHLMWDLHIDAGNYNIAKTLHKDMVNLDKLGLDGMVSCQLLRAAFPTGLAQYCMVNALWNKHRSFEEIKDEYFVSSFKENAKVVEEYLSTLSDLFCCEFIRGEKKLTNEEVSKHYSKVKDFVNDFSKNYIEAFKDTSKDWYYLKLHAPIAILIADIFVAKHNNETEKFNSLIKELKAYVKEISVDTDSVFDGIMLCDSALPRYLRHHIQQ